MQRVACIMMGYSGESKSYWLFDHIKQQIIIRRNAIFDEKYSGIKILNSSLVYYTMIHFILFLTLDWLFPSSFLQISRPLFLTWLVVGPHQLKLFPLLNKPLKWMIVHQFCIYLGGLLILFNQLDLMWVTTPPINIFAVRSSRIVLPWWLMFLRFVILKIM